MKKLLLLAAVVGVAFTGCVSDKDDLGYKGNEAQKEIKFSAPVVGKMSRTAVPGEVAKYPMNETFNVFAMWTKGEFTQWGSGPDSETQRLYMNNEKIFAQPTKNFDNDLAPIYPWTWAPESKFFWPKEGYLTFAAYSPTQVGADFTVAYAADGLSITDFTPETKGYQKKDLLTLDAVNTDKQSTSSVDDVQYDLLYAPRKINATSSTASGPDYAGVDLKFKHALSSIRFTIRVEENFADKNTRIVLNKISLLNIKNKGTFKEKITDGAIYDAAPAWTLEADKTAYTAFECTNALSTPDQNGYDISNIVHATDVQELAMNSGSNAIGSTNKADNFYGYGLILLPQEFTNAVDMSSVEESTDQVIKVEWSLANTTTKVAIPQVHYFDLSALKFTSSSTAGLSAAQWDMGKRYTYNLTIGLEKIFFNPVVEDWENTVPDTPFIPVE